MKKALVWLALLLISATPAAAQGMRDEEIQRIIINDSIARWRGDCPCPYSYAWNGTQCGANSAYTKRVPYGPLCYPHDVSWRDVREYRIRTGR